jgi:TRAP-type mannitol/chloroaromatic compound transport system substrate-binding protein
LYEENANADEDFRSVLDSWTAFRSQVQSWHAYAERAMINYESQV